MHLNIVYSYYITEGHPIFDDETPIEEDEDLEELEEDEEREVCVLFHADNGKNFTVSELLYKLHQRLAKRELGDRYFFEGLSPSEHPTEAAPVFYLYCGS